MFLQRFICLLSSCLVSQSINALDLTILSKMANFFLTISSFQCNFETSWPIRDRLYPRRMQLNISMKVVKITQPSFAGRTSPKPTVIMMVVAQYRAQKYLTCQISWSIPALISQLSAGSIQLMARRIPATMCARIKFAKHILTSPQIRTAFSLCRQAVQILMRSLTAQNRDIMRKSEKTAETAIERGRIRVIIWKMMVIRSTKNLLCFMQDVTTPVIQIWLMSVRNDRLKHFKKKVNTFTTRQMILKVQIRDASMSDSEFLLNCSRMVIHNKISTTMTLMRRRKCTMISGISSDLTKNLFSFLDYILFLVSIGSPVCSDRLSLRTNRSTSFSFFVFTKILLSFLFYAAFGSNRATSAVTHRLFIDPNTSDFSYRVGPSDAASLFISLIQLLQYLF